MTRTEHEARSAQFAEFLGRLVVARENIERLLSLAPSLDLASSVLVDLSRTLADLASTETHASSLQRQHLSLRPEPTAEDLAEQTWPDNAELRSRALEVGRERGFPAHGFGHDGTDYRVEAGEAAWRSCLMRWRASAVQALMELIAAFDARHAEEERTRQRTFSRPQW